MKLKAHPGFEATIGCNGVALEEHDDEDQIEGVKLVEATSGSNFTVNMQVDISKMKKKLEDHVTCEVKMDGKYVCSYVYSVSSIFDNRKHQISGRPGSLNGQSVVQKFMFGDLVTSDGPTQTVKAEDAKQLGEVKVQLCWVRKLGISNHAESRAPVVSSENGSIPEKALKGRAISSRAELGMPEPAPRDNFAKLEYPHGSMPFATYVFKYRSRKDLQIEGVIPRSPSPVPLEERDPDDLSPEEARELIRRMRTQGSEGAVKIKKEKRSRPVEDDGEDDDEVEVTGQHASKRSRLSTDSGVELVDLTDD